MEQKKTGDDSCPSRYLAEEHCPLMSRQGRKKQSVERNCTVSRTKLSVITGAHAHTRVVLAGYTHRAPQRAEKALDLSGRADIPRPRHLGGDGVKWELDVFKQWTGGWKMVRQVRREKGK